MTDPRRIPETKGDGFEIRPRRETSFTSCQQRSACFVGVSFTIVHPVLAEPVSGPIKVIRTEVDDSQENRLHAAYRAYQAGNIGAAKAGYAGGAAGLSG